VNHFFLATLATGAYKAVCFSCWIREQDFSALKFRNDSLGIPPEMHCSPVYCAAEASRRRARELRQRVETVSTSA
jgi:hypothetical protein